MLRKYFYAWQNWIIWDHQQQVLFDNQDKTKSKMAAFLEAAATGKLWTNRNEDGIDGMADEVRRDKSVHRSRSNAQEQVVSVSEIMKFVYRIVKKMQEFYNTCNHLPISLK